MATNRRFQLLTALPEEWESKNPILRYGEVGYELIYINSILDSTRNKVGDGNTAWNDLPYVDDDVYDFNELTTVDYPGIPINTSLNGQKLKDVIKKLVSPFITPNFTIFNINGLSEINLEVGEPLPSNLSLTWSFNDLVKVSPIGGRYETNDDNIVGSTVDLTSLQTTILIENDLTYNEPRTSTIKLIGNDTENNLIQSDNFLINWKGLIKFGSNSTGEISTSNHINQLSSEILTNDPKRTYSFLNGYPFILIPSFIDISNIEFVDGDNNLAFAMDLQGNYDNTLPSTITYSNGNIEINYNILRGEFFYNTPTNIILKDK